MVRQMFICATSGRSVTNVPRLQRQPTTSRTRPSWTTTLQNVSDESTIIDAASEKIIIIDTMIVLKTGVSNNKTINNIVINNRQYRK